MTGKKSGRQRKLTFAVVLGSIFIAVLILIFLTMANHKETYIPGENIPGLTAGLSRTLPPDHPSVTFTDISGDAGIRFIHFSGTRTIQLPEDMGSGAAWGDYDNDGLSDLFAVNFSGPISLPLEELQKRSAKCALYHNNGDGTFTDVASSTGLDLAIWGNAAAWGDVDNDGWKDLLITSYGHNYLFRNNGNGTFEDISKPSHIGGPEGYWSGAAWGDYNKDGFIDVYICGYVEYSAQTKGKISLQYNTEVPASINPSSFSPVANLLYLNLGNNTFREVAETAGVSNNNGRSLSAAWCDFDEDGWPDLYVANDVSDNVFYRNLGDGTFEEISHSAFVADYRGAMGIAIGDWDLDTDMDMFITHWMAQENALYTNLLAQTLNLQTTTSAKVRFMDQADRYGLGQIALEFIGFGTSFFDYDNDGRLDIFVANGSTFQKEDNRKLLKPMPDKIFWNRNNKEGFFDVSAVSGDYFQKKFIGRGAAICDYDNDGDPDIYIANNIGPGVLLRNEGGNRNHWLQVKLKGTKSNADAFGTVVRVQADSMVLVRQVGAQGSYLSQNSLIQHFGLGTHSIVDTLFVKWPSGIEQILTGINANQRIEIIEGVQNLKNH